MNTYTRARARARALTRSSLDARAQASLAVQYGVSCTEDLASNDLVQSVAAGTYGTLCDACPESCNSLVGPGTCACEDEEIKASAVDDYEATPAAPAVVEDYEATPAKDEAIAAQVDETTPTEGEEMPKKDKKKSKKKKNKKKKLSKKKAKKACAKARNKKKCKKVKGTACKWKKKACVPK